MKKLPLVLAALILLLSCTEPTAYTRDLSKAEAKEFANKIIRSYLEIILDLKDRQIKAQIIDSTTIKTYENEGISFRYTINDMAEEISLNLNNFQIDDLNLTGNYELYFSSKSTADNPDVEQEVCFTVISYGETYMFSLVSAGAEMSVTLNNIELTGRDFGY